MKYERISEIHTCTWELELSKFRSLWHVVIGFVCPLRRNWCNFQSAGWAGVATKREEVLACQRRWTQPYTGWRAWFSKMSRINGWFFSGQFYRMFSTSQEYIHTKIQGLYLEINWQTEKQTVFLSKYLQFLILKTMFLLDILQQSQQPFWRVFMR